jgi:hypothetical protein
MRLDAPVKANTFVIPPPIVESIGPASAKSTAPSVAINGNAAKNAIV